MVGIQVGWYVGFVVWIFKTSLLPCFWNANCDQQKMKEAHSISKKLFHSFFLVFLAVSLLPLIVIPQSIMCTAPSCHGFLFLPFLCSFLLNFITYSFYGYNIWTLSSAVIAGNLYSVSHDSIQCHVLLFSWNKGSLPFLLHCYKIPPSGLHYTWLILLKALDPSIVK